MVEFKTPVKTDQPAYYQFIIQGELDKKWSSWFDGMTIETELSSLNTKITTLTGIVSDQSALYGLLSQFRDLGLSLLQVKYIKSKDTSMTPTHALFPPRAVLEGVPRIGYDIHLSPFPGSLFSVLQYIGDPCDYDYIMGVTGAAFRRFWNRDDGGNIDLSYLGDSPFDRIFTALGYSWKKIPAEKEAMIKGFVESINRNIPAISFGIHGPPEAGIVTGYDQEGAILYGWSYFQENRNTYYEKNDWYETLVKGKDGKGCILVMEKKAEKLPANEVLKRSLEWAIDLERTTKRPGFPDHVCGLAAYDGWADAMEVDADYPANNRETLINRVMIHGDQCVMAVERHSAAVFLRQMATIAPKVADQINAAAELYDEAGKLDSLVYPWAPWHEKVFTGLADPKNRRDFAHYVRQAKVTETKAVEHLEKALTILG